MRSCDPKCNAIISDSGALIVSIDCFRQHQEIRPQDVPIGAQNKATLELDCVFPFGAQLAYKTLESSPVLNVATYRLWVSSIISIRCE
eukprot:3348634-Amphidinium_carterae.4